MFRTLANCREKFVQMLKGMIEPNRQNNDQIIAK